MACAGAGVVSNVSTVMQLAVISGMLSPTLLQALWPPVLAAGVVVVLFALGATWATRRQAADGASIGGRAFEPKHALVFVAIVATVMIVSAAMLAWLGNAGLDVSLALSGLADVHAAAASAAQLVAVDRITPQAAVPAIALAFAANSTTKLVMAFATGGRAYGFRLLPGIVAMVAAFAITVWLY
jgi:uncharacterized membrane protein (DUF4010 family)